MNGLESFVISFSGGCIVLGFLYMLCPSGSMSKPVKYVFALCLVCCIIGATTTLSKPDFSYFEATTRTEILTEQNTAITAATIFGEALRQKNINFRKIEVDTNKMENGSITISRVTVYTSADAAEIINAIGSDSYEVYVINE